MIIMWNAALPDVPRDIIMSLVCMNGYMMMWYYNNTISGDADSNSDNCLIHLQHVILIGFNNIYQTYVHSLTKCQ